MKLVEEKILHDSKILNGDVLKVSNFLNHQLDIQFLNEIGKEFFRLFSDCKITKILTIESSGIAIACIAAQYFHVPVVFAKKSKTTNISSDFYSEEAKSYTHGNHYSAIVEKQFISPNDTFLIIDDFLANGKALHALFSLVEKAGAKIAGAGIVIEKTYQQGGEKLRENGYRIESLARIASMSPEDGIKFVN